MRTFLDVMLPESNKSLSRQGSGHSLPQRVVMLSLFSTGLLQSVWFCLSHPQHRRHRWLESKSVSQYPLSPDLILFPAWNRRLLYLFKTPLQLGMVMCWSSGQWHLCGFVWDFQEYSSWGHRHTLKLYWFVLPRMWAYWLECAKNGETVR